MNNRIPKANRGVQSFGEVCNTDRSQHGKRSQRQRKHWKVVPGHTYCRKCETNFPTPEEATVHAMLCVGISYEEKKRRAEEKFRAHYDSHFISGIDFLVNSPNQAWWIAPYKNTK